MGRRGLALTTLVLVGILAGLQWRARGSIDAWPLGLVAAAALLALVWPGGGRGGGCAVQPTEPPPE